jgi:hypothetical protein
MLWNLYLRNGVAYVPTVAQTQAGFFIDIEPVEAVPASDAEALEGAIKQTLKRGNPRIPTPTRAAFPMPVVLKHAKVRSWSAFERNSTNWTIVEKDGHYQIKRGRKRADGGWEDDPEHVEVLPHGVELNEIAQRIALSVQSVVDGGQ